MYCKKCGSPLVTGDQFCKSCGEKVENDNTQNIGTSNVVQSNINNNATENMFGVTPPIQQNQNYNIENNAEMYQQNYGMQTPNYLNNNEKGSKRILIFIGIVAIIIIAVLIIIFVWGKSNSENGGNGVAQNTESTYTVKANGFAFKIPTNLVYQIEDGYIVINDEEGTWAAEIYVVEGSYNQLLSNKNNIKAFLEKQEGCTSSMAVEKTLGGLNYLTVEISYSGQKTIGGYAKANSMYVFSIAAYRTDNEIDYSILTKLSSILKTAVFEEKTNNMNITNKIDISAISELAVE